MEHNRLLLNNILLNNDIHYSITPSMTQNDTYLMEEVHL